MEELAGLASYTIKKMSRDEAVSTEAVDKICRALDCNLDDVLEYIQRRKTVMAEKNSANIGFEKQIWDAACVLWGHIPAAEYRKVIVGLIFLRYISSAFEKRYDELVAEGDGFEDDRDAYAEDNIFFVPENARWNKIASSAHTPEIGTVIDEAMRAIEAENKSLKNVLPKNYASPDLDKRVLGDVVDLFTNMDMGETEESKDLLGRTYEYCIAQFAAYEGVKGGEFYTPASIVKTIVAIQTL